MCAKDLYPFTLPSNFSSYPRLTLQQKAKLVFHNILLLFIKYHWASVVNLEKLYSFSGKNLLKSNFNLYIWVNMYNLMVLWCNVQF